MRSFVVAKKVFKELLRDKRTLAMMFVAPIFIMWLMSIIFSANTSETVKIAEVGVPSNVVKVMKDVDNIDIKDLSNKKDAEQQLKDGLVDTVITYEDNSYEVTYSNTDASKTQVSRQALNAAIRASQTQTLVDVVKKSLPNLPEQEAVKIEESYRYGNEDTTFFNKIVPILIGFIAFFFVFLISGMALLKERTTGTLDRLLATPVKRSEIILGYVLSYGVLATTQSTIISLSAIYLLDIEVVGELHYVIIVSVLLALVAVTFGLLMSTLAKSEFQLMQFIPLIIIPQVFFSGIIPLDGLGDLAVYISKIMPVTYAGDGLSKIVFEGKNLLEIKGDVFALLIFFAVLLTLNIIGLKRYRKV